MFRNTLIGLMLLWLLVLTSLQGNLATTLRYQTGIILGQEEDLRNLQRQLDHTYVRGRLPSDINSSTPTPLRQLAKPVGCYVSEN